MQCYVKEAASFRALRGKSEIMVRTDRLAAEHDNWVPCSRFVAKRVAVAYGGFTAKEVHLVHVTPNG
jgi:hypothetical protein